MGSRLQESQMVPYSLAGFPPGFLGGSVGIVDTPKGSRKKVATKLDGVGLRP